MLHTNHWYNQIRTAKRFISHISNECWAGSVSRSLQEPAYHDDISVPVVILYLSPISDCCPVSHIIYQSPQTWNILPSNCHWRSHLPSNNSRLIFVLTWPLGPFTYKKFTNILQSFIAPRKLKSCSDNDLNYLNKLSLKNLFLLTNAALLHMQ